MVQREIADRLRAAPGSRTYGSPSVLAQLACEVRLLRRVDPAVFRPRPRVDSAILAPAAHRPGRRPGDPGAGARRIRPPSQVAGPLARARRPGLAGGGPRRRWRELGLPEDARAEALSPEEFAALAAKTPAATDRLPCASRPRPSSTSASSWGRAARTACTSSARCSSRSPSPTRSRSPRRRARRGHLPRGRRREPRRARARRAARRRLGAAAAADRDREADPGRRRARAAAAPTPPRSCASPRGEVAGPARRIAAELGADVPVAARPALALVQGAGERVERLPEPAPHAVVLLPGGGGLSTAEVFAEADRLGLGRGDGRAGGARRPAARGGRRRRLAARLRRAARQRPRARGPLAAAARSATRSTRCARPAPRSSCSPAPVRPPSASSPTLAAAQRGGRAPRPRRRDRLRGGPRAVRLQLPEEPAPAQRAAAGRDRRRGRRRLLPAQPR